MKKVACVGILVADTIVSTVSTYPEKGKLEPVSSITVHTGGNAMTAALNLSRLGVESEIFGRVGQDVYGDYLKKTLIEGNVNIRGLTTDASVQTSASVLMIDHSGERSFFHCVGTNAVFSIQDINFNFIKENDLIFVTGSFLLNRFDGEQTMQFLKKCKELGKTTLLDVCWDASGKWGEILNQVMPYIDYFMPSIDEAKELSDETDPEKMAEQFLRFGVQNVIIKMGSEGSYLRLKDWVKGIIFSPYKVENAVDTTGAGDSFCSGFLAGLARGEKPEFCIRLANAVGAHCVMQKGATTGIRSYEETIKFMEERENACNA